MRDVGRAGRGREGGPEPGAGPARRGRDRQDGAAGVRPRPRGGLPDRPGRRRRVRDRARLRRPAPALRAAPGDDGPAARPPARRARLGLRAAGGEPARPVPRGPGRPHPARPGRRGPAADLRRRRRPVAGPGLAADAGVRRTSPAGRAGGDPLRGPRVRRGREPFRAAGARAGRPHGPRRRGSPRRFGHGGARRGRPRPGSRREPRQPARAPRAAPRPVGDRAGLRRRRRSGRHSPGPAPRTGLPPQAGAVAREHPAAAARRGG